LKSFSNIQYQFLMNTQNLKASAGVVIPSTSVGIYPCWTIAEKLFPGITVFLGSSLNSRNAIIDAFAQLSPEQRRDKDLDPAELHAASFGLTAGARTQQDSRSGIRNTSIRLSDRGGASDSRASRRVSSRESRDSQGSRGKTAGGGQSSRGSFVAELTAENLGDMESAKQSRDLGMGFAQRYLPTSAYVLREIAQRNSGRPERENQLVARRKELMALLTSA
jgi:hypothetical protein